MTSPGGPRGRVGRRQREALAAAAPEALPAARGGEAQGPRATPPREGAQDRPHAPKAGEQPLAASCGSASGRTSLPRTPHRRQADASQGPGCAEASEARTVLRSRRRAFTPSPSRGAHPPAPGLRGVMRARAAGSRRVRHSPENQGPGIRNCSSDRDGPRARGPPASQQPFMRLRGSHLQAPVTSVIQTARQWRDQAAGIGLVPPPARAAGTAAPEKPAHTPNPT